MLKVLRNLFESWKASSSKLRYVEFIINEKEIRLDSFFFLEESPMKPSDILFFLRRLDKLIACFVTVDDHALKPRGRKKLICVDK